MHPPAPAKGSGRFWLAVGLAIAMLITAGWCCLAEAHEAHDHGPPHDLCAGLVIVPTATLAAILLAPVGAMVAGAVPFRPTRAVPVLDPPPRLSPIR